MEGKMNYLQRAKGHRDINDAKYRTLTYLESLEKIQFKKLSNTIKREQDVFNNLQQIQTNSFQK